MFSFTAPGEVCFQTIFRRAAAPPSPLSPPPPQPHRAGPAPRRPVQPGRNPIPGISGAAAAVFSWVLIYGKVPQATAAWVQTVAKDPVSFMLLTMLILLAIGTVLAGWRLLRCNPWSHGGVDYAHDQRVFRS